MHSFAFTVEFFFFDNVHPSLHTLYVSMKMIECSLHVCANIIKKNDLINLQYMHIMYVSYTCSARDFYKIEISLIHHIHTFYNSLYFCTNTSSRLLVRIFTHTTFTDMVSSGAVCKIRFVTTLSTTLLFMKNTQNALYCNVMCIWQEWNVRLLKEWNNEQEYT